MNSNYSYHSAVFLIDSKKGSAGKGTFEALLENIAGSNNYATIKLNQFEKAPILATIVNKPLVIGDDNDLIGRLIQVKISKVRQLVTPLLSMTNLKKLILISLLA